MGYDHDDSFSFDFEPHGNPFGPKSKGKLSPRSYPIQCVRNWKYSFLSASSKTPHNKTCKMSDKQVVSNPPAETFFSSYEHHRGLVELKHKYINSCANT